jgi:membrane protein implicated in regulation of membrane protease activity
LQSPGWMVAAIVAWALWRQDVLGGATAGGLLALWVLKDAALYPWLRHAYEPSRPPVDALIGREATARTPLAPDGWVRVGAELWRARLAGDAPPADPGTATVVEKVDGLTLVVRPKD